MCVSVTGQPWWLLHSLLVAAGGSLLRSKAPPLPLSVCLFSCLVSPPCLFVTLSLSFAMPACLVSLQIVFYTTFSTPAETENVLYLLVSVWFFSFSFLSLASTWPINSFSISILCSPVCGYSSTWLHMNSCFSSQTASAAQKPDRNLCRRSSAPRSWAYPADTYALTTNTCRPRGRPTPHVRAVNLFIHTHVRTPTSSVIQISSLFIHLQPYKSHASSEGVVHTRAPEGGDQLHANNNLRGGYRIIKIIRPLTISLAGSELGLQQPSLTTKQPS